MLKFSSKPEKLKISNYKDLKPGDLFFWFGRTAGLNISLGVNPHNGEATRVELGHRTPKLVIDTPQSLLEVLIVASPEWRVSFDAAPYESTAMSGEHYPGSLAINGERSCLVVREPNRDDAYDFISLTDWVVMNSRQGLTYYKYFRKWQLIALIDGVELVVIDHDHASLAANGA